MLSELEPGLRDELLRLGSATVYEASGAEGAFDPEIAAVWPGARLCGPALPVECGHGDNLAIHRALEHAPREAVLVVDAHRHLAGYWGEVLAVAAQARGLAGLVIDGGVRDTEGLERLGFPVFARGRSILRTVKHEPGRVGEPVVAGGVLVRAGDVVLGDADGVVLVRAERLGEVLEVSRARVAREERIMERLRAGELTLDLLGLRPPA
ncbi:MAG TPA: dimethylmenaquinone methyltransferase [Candidatus Dormibacteraeota bacterium]|nr:dimethylmenaquinone methyltransferase [Candidatus Dormibacteraeota bacterium]